MRISKLIQCFPEYLFIISESLSQIKIAGWNCVFPPVSIIQCILYLLKYVCVDGGGVKTLCNVEC